MDSNLENHTQETKKGRGMENIPFFSNNNLKIESVENLSFPHFQQVFNNKLHKEIRQNDKHSTIQQVFNKVFNRQKAIKKK